MLRRPGEDDGAELRRRVLEEYLPVWLENKPGADVSRIRTADWSFLPSAACYWFLAALDAGVVTVVEEPLLGFIAAGGGCIHPLGDRKTKLYREAFFTVAAAGYLVLRQAYAPGSVRFESPRAAGRPEARPWAFDLVVYADELQERVVLAGETKWPPREAEALLAGIERCAARGDHAEHGVGSERNYHRKYRGLLDHEPRLFWIVGAMDFADPDAPRSLFRVEQRAGGLVRLHRLDTWPRTVTDGLTDP
jgi:hypothetical protein